MLILRAGKSGAACIDSVSATPLWLQMLVRLTCQRARRSRQFYGFDIRNWKKLFGRLRAENAEVIRSLTHVST